MMELQRQDKGRATDILYWTCAKHLTLFHMTSWSPNEKYGLDGWATCWIRNWLKGCTQRVGDNGFKAALRRRIWGYW